MKKPTLIFLLIIIIFTVSGCNKVSGDDTEGINVIATIFPPYDFVREIAGDKVNISLLLPPGTESHSYEPTPQDIIKIQKCDLFIYNGGKSESWVNTVLESMDSKINTLAMMETVTVVKEETVEGLYSKVLSEFVRR
jgi:zinc transport system substrate-binding protein